MQIYSGQNGNHRLVFKWLCHWGPAACKHNTIFWSAPHKGQQPVCMELACCMKLLTCPDMISLAFKQVQPTVNHVTARNTNPGTLVELLPPTADYRHLQGLTARWIYLTFGSLLVTGWGLCGVDIFKHFNFCHHWRHICVDTMKVRRLTAYVDW